MARKNGGRPLDRLIAGGTLVGGSDRQEAALGTRGGRVVWIGDASEAPPSEETIDATGKLVLPGAIDPHVHCRAFSAHIDTLGDLARTAAHGGVTTFVVFATGEENETMTAALARFREEGEAASVVDFSLHAWIFEDFDYLAGIPDAIASGVTSFKIMTGYRKRGYGRCVPDDYGFATLDIVGKHGGIALVHAENGLVIDYLENQALAEGVEGADFLRQSRPAAVEAEAVARYIHFADFAKCPLYIVHLTCAEALAEAKRARDEGKNVAVESCPQYLTHTEQAVSDRGSLAKIAPPLRSPEDNNALWKAVQDGSVDLLGSDHASYTVAQKNEHSFTQAPFGAPGAETILPVLYSEGVAAGRISPERLVRLTSENPARILGLYPRKGTLHIGADADIVIIDPNGKTTIRADKLHSNSDYSLYEGWELKGRVEMSLVRGEVVLRNGFLEKDPGFGEFVPRKNAPGRAGL